MARSSAWRWRMTFCAEAGSLHRPGSSARLFSSASRAGALGMSKMPPQQGQRLADGVDELFGFGPHWGLLGLRWAQANAARAQADSWRWYRRGAGACKRALKGLPQAAAPAREAARRVLLVTHKEAAALVGETDDRVGIIRLLVRLEGLEHAVGLRALGAHARAQTDAHEFDARWNAEGHRLLVGERHFHELTEDRGGDVTTGHALAHRPRRVVADEHADHQVRRIADEPGVLLLVGGAGLAGDGNVGNVFLDHRGGAALHHALHDRGHLIGGVRIKDLLAVIGQHRFG